MTEKPIIFSGEMVRAILAGRKTQTRRVVKPQPGSCAVISPCGSVFVVEQWPKTGRYFSDFGRCKLIYPPYEVGYRLWVREAHALIDNSEFGAGSYVQYRADTDGKCLAGNWPDEMRGDPGVPKWRPSIHMPRWASRITLEVTGVRPERLQAMNRADAMEEGCPFSNMAKGHNPRIWFSEFWDLIHGKGSWDENPWVWVVEFRWVQQ